MVFLRGYAIKLSQNNHLTGRSNNTGGEYMFPPHASKRYISAVPARPELRYDGRDFSRRPDLPRHAPISPELPRLAERPEESRNPMKILIVRVSSLGDVVHNMPMTADIMRHFPDATIDWVVEEGYVDLIRLNRHVRHVIPYALRRWRKNPFSAATRAEFRAFRAAVQQEAYDVVFDTQGLLKTGAVMGLARLAPRWQESRSGQRHRRFWLRRNFAHFSFAERAGRCAHPRGHTRTAGGGSGTGLPT